MKIKKYASLGVLVLLVLSIMSGCSLTPQHKAITDTQFRHAMDVEGFTVKDKSGNPGSNPLYQAIYGKCKASLAVDKDDNELMFLTCADSDSATKVYSSLKDLFDQSIDLEHSGVTNTPGTTERGYNYARYTRSNSHKNYNIIQVNNTIITSAASFSNNTHIEDIIKKLGYSS